MKLRSLLFLILCTALFGACSHGDSERILRQAETVVQERPDSALRLLQSLDRHRLRGEREARFCLLYTMAQDKSLITVDDDSLLHYAFDYYKCHTKDTLAPRAYYYMGLCHAFRDSSKQAEECLNECLRICEQHKDYYTEYLALDRLKRLTEIDDPQRALAYAQKAYIIYDTKCPPNIYNKVQLLLGIAGSFCVCGEADSAMYYDREALALACETADSSLLSNVYQGMSSASAAGGNKAESLHYARKAWSLVSDPAPSLTFNIAHSYMEQDSLPIAMSLLEPLAETGNALYRYLAYFDLATIEAKSTGAEKVVELADSSCTWLERMYLDALHDKAVYAREKEQELMAKYVAQARATTRMWILILTVLLAISAILVMYHLFRMRSERQRQAQERAETQAAITQAALERERRESERREREVRIMRQSWCERLSLIASIKGENSGKKSAFSKEEWDGLREYLEVMENSFVSRLSNEFPRLRETDLRFCMLVRIGFSTPQLAGIFHVSEVSIKQRLLRYKETFGINNSSTSARDFILHF